MCCGKERLAFAVEIARRANERSKIIVVDGLETLDPAELEPFVREATRDGYQLLATRVEGGEAHLEAIELEESGTETTATA
jgi:hypothetical protein